MASPLRRLPLVFTLIFIACVGALLATFGSIVSSFDRIRTISADIERASGLIHDTRMLRESVLGAELGQQGYLITGNSLYLDAYRFESKRRTALLGGLTQRLSADPEQLKLVENLREMTQQTLTRLDQPLLAFESGGREAALEIARGSPGDRSASDGIRATTEALIQGAEKILQQRNALVGREYWITVASALGVNLVAILTLALFYSLARRHFGNWIAAEEALRRHNEDLEGVIQARSLQLSRLSRYLIRVADDEKAKLARELHDELGSNLTAVSLDVAAVEDKLKAAEPALAQRLGRAQQSLHAVVGISRRVIEDLRPGELDHASLADAMRGHCIEFSKRTGLPCIAEVDADLGAIDPRSSYALFRVAQESLTNAAKYARAAGVRLSLRREDQGFRLRVADDGVGIALDALNQPLAHGLLGMRERIAMLDGSFAVGRGDNDRGTVVEAFLPFGAAREQRSASAG